MKKRAWLSKLLAFTLTAALLPWPSGTVNAEEGIAGMEKTAQEAESAQKAGAPSPAYFWNFENTSGSSIGSVGSETGNAVLRGTAATQKRAITAGNVAVADQNNSVLVLGGGNKGTSYADLPGDLYKGVSADTGLTWSFWMKPDTDIVSYSRLFSSTNSSNGMEFAYVPYASDKNWNLIFDGGSTNEQYRKIYGSEPAKSAWSYITITVSDGEVVFYINGNECAASSTGDVSVLAGRLNGLASFTNHALGKTTSTWSDKDCKVELDDVAVYKTALTKKQVVELAKSYGLSPVEPQEPQPAQEGSYGTEKKQLEQVTGLTTTSVDGKNVVKIWKDSDNRYYYSVSRNGKVVIECSAIGMVTKNADLSSGLSLDTASIVTRTGEEDYDILQGSASHVNKKYSETAFTLTKANSRMTLYFRVFEDGMAYRYEVDGDTASTVETTTITGETSEFVLPDNGTIWTVPVSQTYEGIEYSKRTMEDQYETAAKYSTPILASLGEDSDNSWVLLAEANVYNEEEPYCASVFKTEAGSKAIQTTFGLYLKQETDESKDKTQYSPSYDYISQVNMQDVFHTPWRTAVIASDLEGIANSSLIMDLNPAPKEDFSWVQPGACDWSWWSTTEDAIQYTTMLDYIDFAAETGMKYCLVDYGWELWENFREQIASLVDYADTKGIGILVWYGVNKFDARHIFDLDSADAIEEEFEWCEKVGIKGVKVDYINSDSQFAMKVMYNLADLAAKYHLVLNYHGCTNPRGENRTYPNILSSEAVAGMENFKWNNGSSVTTLLTLPYTRNVLGSMEFTPTAYRVSSSKATSGFMLANVVVYESALQSFAHSAYVYPGYAGLSLLSDVPTTWDESRLLEGYPGESVIRARRKGENWYLGAMTLKAKTYQVPLDFLDAGSTYHAYIYKDTAAGESIEIETQDVTSETVLQIPLLENGGCSVKFSKTDPLKTTVYDNFNYYEAEDSTYAALSGEARVDTDNYASNLKCVGYVGGNAANTLTFSKINAKTAGQYTLRVYFVSGAARDLYVRVNNGEGIKLEGLVGNDRDWAAVAVKEIPIRLNQGENSICLYNNEAYAPNIDRIAVSKSDISNAEVSIEKESYTYTGAEITPDVSVRYDGIDLVKDQDFTVRYVDNREAGTAQVVITGIGNCCGTITRTFVIGTKSVSIKGKKTYTKTYGNKAFVLNTTCEGTANGKLTYTSSNKSVLTVSSGGKVTLKATGTATVTVKLESKSYKANDYKITITVKPSKMSLSSVKSKKKKQLAVSWKKLSTKQNITGYQVSYSTKKNFKSAKTVKVKKASKACTLKKLKSKKKYYVRIRAYKKVGKSYLYGAWSKAKSTKVK